MSMLSKLFVKEKSFYKLILSIAVPVVLFTFVGVNTLLPGLHSYG